MLNKHFFVRLTQHLKVKHRFSQHVRKKEVSRQKVIRTAGKTKTQEEVCKVYA